MYRARCLAPYFDAPEFDIGYLLAPRTSHTGESIRARQTLLPFAERVGLPIVTDCDHGDSTCVVRQLHNERTRPALVSWSHSELGDILRGLGVPSTLEWTGYDAIWRVTGGRVLVMQQPSNCTLPATQ